RRTSIGDFTRRRRPAHRRTRGARPARGVAWGHASSRPSDCGDRPRTRPHRHRTWSAHTTVRLRRLRAGTADRPRAGTVRTSRRSDRARSSLRQRPNLGRDCGGALTECPSGESHLAVRELLESRSRSCSASFPVASTVQRVCVGEAFPVRCTCGTLERNGQYRSNGIVCLGWRRYVWISGVSGRIGGCCVGSCRQASDGEIYEGYSPSLACEVPSAYGADGPSSARRGESARTVPSRREHGGTAQTIRDRDRVHAHPTYVVVDVRVVFKTRSISRTDPSTRQEGLAAAGRDRHLPSGPGLGHRARRRVRYSGRGGAAAMPPSGHTWSGAAQCSVTASQVITPRTVSGAGSISPPEPVAVSANTTCRPSSCTSRS